MPYSTTSGGLNFQYPTQGTKNWDSVMAATWSLISGHNHEGAPDGVKLGAAAMNFAWSTWSSPTLTGNGSMTTSAASVTHAKYMQLGKLAFCAIYVTFTIGGVANTRISIALPVNAASTDFRGSGGGYVIDGGGSILAKVLVSPGVNNTVGVEKSDNTSWSTGASRVINISFFYETT